MNMLTTLSLFLPAAVAEIVGCYLVLHWAKRDGGPWRACHCGTVGRQSQDTSDTARTVATACAATNPGTLPS